MGLSTDYPDVAEWKAKDTGYHTGDMVRYQNNIFIASYWAGKEPGVDPGWALYDELYDQTSRASTQPAKIIGYLPTWRTSEGFDYGDAAMYRSITHGIIAFLKFDDNALGELDQSSAKDVAALVPRILAPAHQAGTTISVSLGGATDYGFLHFLSAVGTNADDARMASAVRNVVAFVQQNDLDGVDLDLECWWDPNGDASKDQGGRAKSQGPHPAGSALTRFAEMLKVALPGKLISATVFGTSWYGNNYDAKLADYVDWLSIMSYDFTGSWDNSPAGPHTAVHKIRKPEAYAPVQQGSWPPIIPPPPGGSAPMSDNPILSLEDAVWYWSNPFYVNSQGAGQKIARDKIIAGVPLYAYDFAYKKDPDQQSGQTPPGYKQIRYKDLFRDHPTAHTAADAKIEIAGQTRRPLFVKAPGTYPYKNAIFFETPATATDKLAFVKQIGTQGVMVWELSNEVWEDGKSIVKALYAQSGNPSGRPPILRQLGTNTGTIKYNNDDHKFDSLDFVLNPGQKTFFLIHGWNSTPGIFTDPKLDSWLRIVHKNANIITVDWAATAQSEVSGYFSVAKEVPNVAESLSSVFKELGINPTDTTVIGHSLGAHIAGFASNDYRLENGGYIGEIVGLDPAAPFLEVYNGFWNAGLGSTHAKRVVSSNPF